MKNSEKKNIQSHSINTVLSAVHLVPYLPYGLKLQYVVRDKVEKTGIMKSIIHNEYETHPTKVSIEWGDAEHIWMFKPILRPISDLDWIIKIEFDKYDSKRNYDKEIINLFCEENGIDELLENLELSSIRYECVEYMFKNHYDFFGLIEKGLAIDINTLSVE